MIKVVVEAAEIAATSRTSRKDVLVIRVASNFFVSCVLVIGCLGRRQFVPPVTSSAVSCSSVALDLVEADGVLNELLAVAEVLLG